MNRTTKTNTTQDITRHTVLRRSNNTNWMTIKLVLNSVSETETKAGKLTFPVEERTDRTSNYIILLNRSPEELPQKVRGSQTTTLNR